MLPFEPITINTVTIPNRIVKSAMAEGRCDASGRPSPALTRMYEKWAKGGVGLTITGMMHIRKNFSFTGHEAGLYEDDLIDGLKPLPEAVHKHGGRVFAQICHAPPQLTRRKAKKLGAVAPSWGFNRTSLLFDRKLRDDELRSIVQDFGAAAWRAKEAGFDGIQLHGAHGYLISRFLSPRYNRRHDRWGGSFEGRLAFLEAIYLAIRQRVGDGYPVTIKLNAHDGCKGLDLETSTRIARRLEQWGFDAIEVSAGTADVGLSFFPNRGGIPIDDSIAFLRQEFPALWPILPLLRVMVKVVGRSIAFPGEAYFLEEATRIAENVNIPVICVGGVRSLDMVKRILTETPVSMISMARPLVRQPALPRQWEKGKSLTANCVSCNRCFVQVGLGQRLTCWES